MKIFDTFRAVFWGFFGVRKHAAYESDAQNLKATHVIAAGIVSVIVFVLAIYGVVKLVTR